MHVVDSGAERGDDAYSVRLRCRYLKWDDAPCDLNSVGGIKVICEVELSP